MTQSVIDIWKDQRAPLQRRKSLGGGEIIPTWQVGQEQPHPNDIALYASDGYSQNSLIYSCVKEKATSYAPLRPLIERADGQHISRHRLLSLLDRPNSYQDGTEFAEIMATQYEVAGNVYIEKVRESANRDMRRQRAGWPVQELSLIRPDYVTIQPAASREDDLFVITIQGQIRRKIPRANIIHIHEPNLINDFYGLSKIALLVREGSLDLLMTDQQIAFFRNAGVPYGLLYVKGRQTADQTTETKSRFKQAFNGARKWFDLLVLNQDEARYEQLGLKQNDMEMAGSRDHVETRICSVFGVPPIIVGAQLIVRAGGFASTYEDAEHAFWSETMVPFVMRFARAYTMHLLPEFALVADTGAKVTYDFTAVRALQEDRSRKLREVVRMANTGGFTINQALTTNGLPAIEGGDFYIRTGNQVEVRIGVNGEHEFIVPPVPVGSNAPNPDNPLEGAARLGGIMDEIEDMLEKAAT